jgi:hypothetical protein
MRKLNLLIATIIGVLILGLTGCQKDNNNSRTSGRLIINVTDDPFPIELIEEASVTITKVEIRIAGETEGYPFLTLFEDTIEFNLLELRNGVMAELLDLEVPVGKYNLVRLYVDEASIRIKGWDSYTLKVPSGAQTGIKIFINPDLGVKGGLTTELLLDFNLDRSFVLKGNMNTPAGINGFNFKPVIRAVNNSMAGRIEGTVTDTAFVELSNASVWLEQDSIIATAFTDTLGFYAMIGIPAGFYSIYATLENYDTVVYHDVEIVEANRTIQDFVLTPK